MSSPTTSRSPAAKASKLLPTMRAFVPYAIYLCGFAIGMYHGHVSIESRKLESSHQATQNKCVESPTITSTAPPQEAPPVQQNEEEGWKTIDVFFGKVQEPMKQKKRRWFSQANQDQLIIGLLRGKREGFFVDLAANDAQRLSNTYALERYYGWTGICIEPNPEYWFDHSRYRTCKLVAAIVGDERMEEITFNYRGVYGGIKKPGMDNENIESRGLPLPAFTVPLEELLTRVGTPRVIDYLSLDVEGAEFYVMQHFPFSSHQIKIMTVERPKEDLKVHLNAHGFQMMAQISNWGETLWVHKTFVDELDLSVLEPEAIEKLS